jgi:hypothetical protein
MQFVGSTLVNQTIVIDGNSYANCTFEGCTLIFNATAIPTLSGCKFTRTTFALGGHADLTVQFLTALYASGAHDIVNVMLSKIRGDKGK